MRSRLEAGFARWLDVSGVKWEYEPFALSGDHGQWLPDFHLHDVWWMDPTLLALDTMSVLVECKPVAPDEALIARIARTSSIEGDEYMRVIAWPDSMLWVAPSPDGEPFTIPVHTMLARSPDSDTTWLAFVTAGFGTRPWQGEWWR
jgi:hypothetical protein